MTQLKQQDVLLARIREIWESQRAQAVRSVNTAHVCANWLIGQQIVEAEQGGLWQDFVARRFCAA